MAKIWKRIICLAVVVLLAVAVCPAMSAAATEVETREECYVHGDMNRNGSVDNLDAIYLLYHSLFEGTYPTYQASDLDGNGIVDNKDALGLLYAYMGMETSVQLKGVAHQPASTSWVWKQNEAGAVSVSLVTKCTCGKDRKTYTSTNGDVKLELVEGKTVAATCINMGSVTYLATWNDGTNDITEEKTFTVPALGENGHDWEGTLSCTEDMYCKNCSETRDALGHQWNIVNTPATCDTDAYDTYTCTRMGCTVVETKTIPGTKGCVLTYKENGDTLVSGETCKYVKVYHCSVCNNDFNGTAETDTYYKHTFNNAVETTPATCSSTGVWTYTCAIDSCNATETKTIPTNEKHTWVEGICACGNKKVGENGKVNTENLSANTTVENNGASLTLDEGAASSLKDKGEISINVDQKEKSTLSTENQAKVGTNAKVYDITITNDGGNVTFSGSITVSIPYTLADGEDPDGIDIWYVNGETLERCKGVYSGGYVTFTTTHFSEYTVAYLSAAERCAAYGHVEEASHKDATCIEDGYDMTICTRCGTEITNVKISAPGHVYETVTAATCMEVGEKKCKTCDAKAEIPATGHSYTNAEKVETKIATCTEGGYVKKTCDNCDFVMTESENKPTGHKLTKTSVAPSCTAGGSDSYSCENCDYTETRNETPAYGHRYQLSGWSWDMETMTATANLVCATNSEHTETLAAVVTFDSTASKAPTCLTAGESVYHASASYNTVVYTDTYAVPEEAAGHMPGNTWESDAASHYRLCTVCGGKMNKTEHTWGEAVVSTTPTCSTTGTQTVTCTACNYTSTQELSATGMHNFVNGVCSCGMEEKSCSHLVPCRTQVDLSAYDICAGGKIYRVTCDCGKGFEYYEYSLACDLEWGEGDNEVCKDCGLKISHSYEMEVDKDACMGTEVYGFVITLDGKTIVTSSQEMGTWSHPYTETTATKTLTGDGVCGLTLITRACPCGRYEYTDASEETACVFVWIDGKSICETCNVTVTSEEVSGKQVGCEYLYELKITISMGDKVLYTVTDQDGMVQHDTEILSYRLLGETCEEGIRMTVKCKDCGLEEEYFSDYHEAVKETRIDLGGKGTCATAIVITTCPCEKQYRSGYLEGRCENFEFDHYDSETETSVFVCADCGLIEESTTLYGDKDESCYTKATYRKVYKTAAGEVLGTVYWDNWGQYHDYEESCRLLGKSCQDGVEVTLVCADCKAVEEGYSHIYYEHYFYTKESVDLREYGVCFDEVGYMVCYCGEEAFLGWSSDDGSWCDWDYENPDGPTCKVCGLQEEQVVTGSQVINTCHNREFVTLKLIKDGQLLTNMGYNRTVENHETTRTITVLTTCNGTVRIDETCKNCDYTGSWEHMNMSEEEEHPYFWLGREVLVEDSNMCGTLVREYHGCACGEKRDEYVFIQAEEGQEGCDFDYENTQYDAVTGMYEAQCTKCGLTYAHSETEYTKEEEGTCLYEGRVTYAYIQDGLVLYEYEDVYTWENHVDLVTFNGSCDTGYTVTRTCAICQATDYWTDETVYNGCEQTFQTAFESLMETPCGRVGIATYRCACGKNSYTHLMTNACYLDGYQYDYLTGKATMTCSKCGLKVVTWETSTELNGCTVEIKLHYELTYGGEKMADTWTYQTYWHDYVYTNLSWSEETRIVTCLGTCIQCGETANQTFYEMGPKDILTVQRYDLSKYGICDGEVYQTVSMDGTVTEWSFWSMCRRTFSEEGVNEYCDICQTKYNYGVTPSESDNPDDCQLTGTYTFTAFREGVAIPVISGTVNRPDHVYVLAASDASLDCNSDCNFEYACNKCNAVKEETHWGGNGHEMYPTQIITGLGCDGKGKITYRKCLCGEYVNIWEQNINCLQHVKMETLADGSNKETRACSTCGLTVETITKEDNQGSCYRPLTGTVIVTKNSETVATLPIQWVNEYHTAGQREYHDPVTTENCRSGILYDATCTLCGAAINGYWTGNHELFEKETKIVDGTNITLVNYVCSCGTYERYDLSKADNDRLIKDYLDVMVIAPNALMTLDNAAYNFKESDGSYPLRMAEFWLEDTGCVAKEHQLWQVNQGGTWTDLVSILTGYETEYHTYDENGICTKCSPSA